MKKFAWPVILNALDEREKSIADALGAAQRAKEEMANLKADNEKLLQEISERNYRIISDLLNVSRIERGVLSVTIEEVQLFEIIETVVQNFAQMAEDKGLDLIFDYPGYQIPINADRDKLIEALSNVVHNALKFTETGSVVVHAGRNDQHGIIDVKDTGEGIPQQALATLFQKQQIFHGAPTSRGGCGLGLYIAKRFMNLMNAQMRFYRTAP